MFKKLSTTEKLTAVMMAPLNAIATLLDLIFCIPGLGRVLKWVWNTLISLPHLIAGLIEFGLWKLGIQPLKKLRIGIIVLCDENSQPLVDAAAALPAIEQTIQTFAQAKVKILPALQTPKKLSEAGDTLPPSDYWVCIPIEPASKRIAEVDCNMSALFQDFAIPGMRFQYLTLRWHFFSAFRRLSGYGAPVIVFVVRKVGKYGGCSMGWISDYVTVTAKHTNCMAHEIGHACNLPHHEDKHNLMYPKSCTPTQLTEWQIALLRASRHVTFF